MIHEKCETDLEAYEALYKHNGARITFYCDRVFYSGIIDEIIPEASQVKLRHTKIADEDTYFGTLSFRFCNIKSFTVIESAESVNRIPRNTYLLKILKSTRTGPDDSVCKVLYADRLPEETDDEDRGDDEEEQEFALNLPFHLKSRLPNESVVIDEFDVDFKFAVRHISDQRIIGVSLEGPAISRFGKLSWLGIGTRDCVFLFDMEALKREAFERGLRDVFEAESIKKVFHNCRHVSDLLAWQYSTLLTNVFDTQVANFVIDLQRYDEKYEFKNISSLECCLRNWLKVPPEYLFRRESIDVLDCYSKRPVSNAFRHDLVNKVLYLILLQERLFKELLAPLHKLTGDYLTVLTKASDDEFYSIGRELSPPDAIPPHVLMDGVQVMKFEKPLEKAPIPLGDIKTEKAVEPGKEAVPSSPVRNCIANKNGKGCKKIPLQGNRSTRLLKVPKSHLGISKNDADKDVDCISVRPSQRHMDEVYHKLVNKVCSNEPVINVKPVETYVSIFSVRKSPDDISGHTDNKSHTKSTIRNDADSCTTTVSETTTPVDPQDITNHSDIWTIIRADESICSDSPYLDNRKIQFIPA